MLQITNQPIRRTREYATEAGGPLSSSWWHRRYRPAKIPSTCARLILPHNPALYPKQIDPRWRSSWDSWVLLTYQGSFGCHVLFVGGNSPRWGMRTLIPVQTRWFAMRAGPEPVQIVVSAADESSEFRAPEFYFADSIKPKQVLDGYAVYYRQPITFI